LHEKMLLFAVFAAICFEPDAGKNGVAAGATPSYMQQVVRVATRTSVPQGAAKWCRISRRYGYAASFSASASLPSAESQLARRLPRGRIALAFGRAGRVGSLMRLRLARIDRRFDAIEDSKADEF
jgi:hypothetical protein